MNLKNLYIKTISSVLILFASAHAFSLESDADAEMTIQSDRAEFDRMTGIAIYTGRVVMEQGTLLIKADKITLYSDTDQKLKKSVAVGKPAHYQQLMDGDESPTKALGQTITYLADKKIITLLEDAFLEQEGNSFSGSEIIYDITNENIKAKGVADNQPDGRVKMIIQPAKTAEVVK